MLEAGDIVARDLQFIGSGNKSIACLHHVHQLYMLIMLIVWNIRDWIFISYQWENLSQ